MIEATLIEQQAYALAMVHEIELAEEERKRQGFRPWVAIDEIRKRVTAGLQCTVNHADELITSFIGSAIEVHESGRAIRPLLNKYPSLKD